MIIHTNNMYRFYDEINEHLRNKKVRKSNYPSEITENIVKFSIKKYYGIMPIWETKNGDLQLDYMKLEVKGSIDLENGGPTSFGPLESWNRIYFVNCKYHHELKFTVYEIKLSNSSYIWKNIKLNKLETYEQQCIQKRRPRILFRELIKQIPQKYIKIIFDDYIDKL